MKQYIVKSISYRSVTREDFDSLEEAQAFQAKLQKKRKLPVELYEKIKDNDGDGYGIYILYGSDGKTRYAMYDKDRGW